MFPSVHQFFTDSCLHNHRHWLLQGWQGQGASGYEGQAGPWRFLLVSSWLWVAIHVFNHWDKKGLPDSFILKKCRSTI